MQKEQISATGIVLSQIPIGDYDKRITILTKELGKINAFVRGAKRPNSPYAAVSDPFAFGEFMLYPGKNAYNLAKVNMTEYFEALHQDLEAIWYGSYFLELADYYGRENVDASEQLNLIYISLKALCDERFSNRLVRAVYECKTLAVNGEQPDFYSCVQCKKKEKLRWFLSRRNGCMCSQCATERPAGAVLVEESALYAMQYVVNAPIGKIFTFRLSDDALLQFEEVMRDYYAKWVDRKFKTLKFLEDI